MRYQKGFAPIIIAIFVVLFGSAVFLASRSEPVRKLIAQTESIISPTFSSNPTSIPLITPKPTPIAAPLKTQSPTPKPTKPPTPVPTPRQISVSGFSYEDRNDNGIMDSDDPKIPYMQLFFYDSTNPSQILNTVFTDVNGNFTNSLSILGNMILTPTTYNNFRPRGGSLTFTGNTSDIKIGFRSASAPVVNQSGILEGNIYNDVNRNHVRDNGESSIYFYKLYLQDASGNYYNTVENAQTTDTGGHFKFINLPIDRTYTIRLSNPDYIIDTTQYSYTLSPTNPQNTNIEIPVFKP